MLGSNTTVWDLMLKDYVSFTRDSEESLVKLNYSTLSSAVKNPVDCIAKASGLYDVLR